MGITIVADEGTHLLIADGERYAMIERRNDHFYSCHDDRRAGTPAKDLSSAAKILDNSDWTDRKAAQAAFNEVVSRGTQLAQRML